VGNAFVRIVREDGAAGLFRGATPTIVRAMALNMGMLASNEQVGVGGCVGVGVCMRLYVWMGVCGCSFVRAMALSMGMLASNEQVCVGVCGCVGVHAFVRLDGCLWVFVCVCHGSEHGHACLQRAGVCGWVGGCVGVCMRLYVWMGVCGCYFVRAMALSMGMLASNKRVCVCVWVRLCVWIGVWVFVCVSG